MISRTISVTREDIKAGLQSLGIQTGDVLGVHSSLSNFGYVEGGADTVLEALFETVGHAGTIVMSTYLVGPPVALTEEDIAKGISWKVKRFAFDDRNTESGMGVIADTFRQHSDVVRSYHPIHSVSAWGKDANIFCQSFKPLVETGGKILLLGVQMDRCSALHIAEERVKLPEDIRKLMAWEIHEELLKVYSPNKWVIGCKGAWGDFLIVQEEAERLGLIESVMIGSATVRLFEAKSMVELYEKLLTENPHRMFGIKNENSA